MSLSVVNIEAQTSIALSNRAESVKRKIAQLASGDKISVVRLHAEEEYGTFQSSDANEFTFYDIDRKSTVTLTFEEVKKVKDGYGGYNSLNRRHTDRTKALVAGLILAGALAGLLVAVAVSK
jgi:hypothetical protein